MVSIIVKLSASHENYSIAKRSKSFQYNPWLLDAENFQKTKGLLNVKLLLSLSKLCDLKGKYDPLFSLDIFIPTHSLTSSLLTLTQTDFHSHECSYSVLILKACVHTDKSRTILAEDQLDIN